MKVSTEHNDEYVLAVQKTKIVYAFIWTKQKSSSINITAFLRMPPNDMLDVMKYLQM